MSEKVLMQDLIDALARDRKVTKREAEAFIKTLFDLIEEALENDQYIKIKGLGTFKLVGISSRESVNVNTGERFVIEGHTRISFTPDVVLRDLVNKPFAHFETVVLGEGVEFGDLQEDENPEDSDPSGEENMPEDTPISEERTGMTEEETAGKVIMADPVEQGTSQESAQTDPMGEKSGEEENLIARETGPEEPEKETPEKDNRKTETMKPEDKQGLPYFIAVVAIVIVVLSGTIIYVYKPGLLLDLLPSAGRETIAVADTVRTSVVHPGASVTQAVDTLKKDSTEADGQSREMPFDKVLREVREEKAVKPKKTEQSAQALPVPRKAFPAREPVRPDSTGYVITGTKTSYTLQPGETLVMVSKRFYGTKDLWPYIARYNRDVIRNPDKVPYGITLRVPELKKK